MNDTPEQLIAALHFNSTAGKLLKSAADTQDLKAFQKAFSKNLAKPAKSFGKSVADFAMTWSSDWPWSSVSDATLADRLTANSDIAKALNEQLATESTIGPFEALVVSEFLLRQSADISPQLLANLVVRLATFELAEVNYSTRETPDRRLPEQLAHYAEAPFVVGLVLNFLKTSKSLLQAGRRNLASIIADSTEKDGTLHSDLAGNAFYFFASYVRVSAWAESFKEPWANTKTSSLWQASLTQAAAVCDTTGFVLDCNSGSRSASAPSLLLQGCKLAGFGKTDSITQLLTGLIEDAKLKKTDRKQHKTGTSAGSSQSDWAASAVLRNGVVPHADVIGLSWSEDQVQLGISCQGKRLLTGDWNYSIKINSEHNTPMGQWVCTCWFIDDDVAFAELEKGTTDGTRHVRHVMLSTTENLALLVDTVTCSDPDSEVEFESHLGSISTELPFLQRNPITRELRGGSSMPQLRIIPAWLEDDRLINARGDCVSGDNGINMVARGTGGVTVPLIIDWKQDRKFVEADWNRLTITEDRKVLSSHTAGGYRVRIGIQQWLIFRSLRKGDKLRAVMGYNTAHETVYGRIRNTGTITPLVMVESGISP